MSEERGVSTRRTFLLEIAPHRGPAAARRLAVPGDEPLATLRLRLARDCRLGDHGSFARSDAPASPLPDEGTLESLGLSVGDVLSYSSADALTARRTAEAPGQRAASPSPGWWLRIADAYAGPPVEEPPPAARALALRVNQAAMQRAEWDVDPHGGDRRPRGSVEADLALAEEVLAHVGADADRYEALARATEASLTEWLASLPGDLASHGQWSTALALCDRGARVGPPAPFLCHRADLLLRAGRRDEAIGQANEVVNRFGDDPTALARAAGVFFRLDANTRAEALCRRVLATAPDIVSLRDGIDDDAWFARLDAAETLVTLLRASGRFDEAAALEQQELVGPDADVHGDPGPLAGPAAPVLAQDAPLLIDDPPMEHTGVRPSRHPPPPASRH